MDPRHPAPHPFSRPQLQPHTQPQSHTLSQAPRFQPIPPSPYSSQSSVLRPDPPQIDHLFPRREPYEPFASPTTLPDKPRSYGFPPGPSIPPSLFTPKFSSDTNDGGLRRGSYGPNVAYNHTGREEQDMKNRNGMSISLLDTRFNVLFGRNALARYPYPRTGKTVWFTFGIVLRKRYTASNRLCRNHQSVSVSCRICPVVAEIKRAPLIRLRSHDEELPRASFKLATETTPKELLKCSCRDDRCLTPLLRLFTFFTMIKTKLLSSVASPWILRP